MSKPQLLTTPIRALLRQAIAALHSAEKQLNYAKKGKSLADYRTAIALSMRPVWAGKTYTLAELIAKYDLPEVEIARVIKQAIPPLAGDCYPLQKTVTGANDKVHSPTGRPTKSTPDQAHKPEPLSKADAELALALALQSLELTKVKSNRKFSSTNPAEGWQRKSDGASAHNLNTTIPFN